jgi:DNA-binding SARP family transcriptional activator
MSRTQPMTFLLWDGNFDEIAAAIFVGVLRQAGVCVKVVGLQGERSAGACGLVLVPDYTLSQASTQRGPVRCVILPLSGPLSPHLQADGRLRDFCHRAAAAGARFVSGAHAPLQMLGIGMSEQCVLYPAHDELVRFAQSVAVRLTTDDKGVSMPATLQARLFGDFQLICGRELTQAVTRERVQLLLIYLLLNHQTPQARRKIAFLFWPETNEKQAFSNLRSLLSRLRRTAPELEPLLAVDSKTIRWRAPQHLAVDMAEFVYAVAQLQPAESTGSEVVLLQALRRVVDSYPAELLPNFYDDWILAARQQLRNHFFFAGEWLIALLRARGDYRTAIHYAHRLLAHDPLSEATYRLLIELYGLNGERLRAMQLYQHCCDLLARELDVAPSPATQASYVRAIAE